MPLFQPGRRFTICAPGDSYTLNFSNGLTVSQYWPERLSVGLNALGCDTRSNNLGVSGDTTAMMLARVSTIFTTEPDIGIVHGCSNDIHAGLSDAATTANLQAIIKCFKFRATGSVAAETNLPASQVIGSRRVVMADGSSDGGVAGAGSSLMPTITGAGGSAQTVWEARSASAGTAGWSRIATASTRPTHVTKILVGGLHYLNWSSGGDTLATPVATWDASTGRRSLQIAAAAAENGNGAEVIYNNVYDYFRNLIVGGTEIQGSASWHYADQDPHLNALGEQYIANAALATIQAQSGWLKALGLQ